jgi:glycogen synthase
MLLSEQPDRINAIRKQIMNLDFSWEGAAQQYIDVYESAK